MTRWYRAYEGTVTDAKLGEAAFVSECSRSVAIAAWHAILENCAVRQEGGRFDLTARRLAVILCEPVGVISNLLNAFEEIGMTHGGLVCAWKERQYESDSSTERSRRHREAKRNGDATLQQRSATIEGRDATPPETETDTEKKKDISFPSETRPKQVRTPKARKAYPDDFEAFWKAYPTDANQSKAEALTAWQRLGDDDRQQAIASVPGFLAFCAKDPTYRPIHACRYLTKRRFEGHSTGPPVQTLVYTGPTRRDRTEAEIEALLLAEEEKDNARDHGDELPAGSVDMRQVQSA